MLMVRMAGLIALPLLATTLQASVRTVPESASSLQVGRRPEKREHILVLSPNTQVWQDSVAGHEGEHPGSEPVAFVAAGDAHACWFVLQRFSRAASEIRLSGSPALRSWLVCSYPHAPPA